MGLECNRAQSVRVLSLHTRGPSHSVFAQVGSSSGSTSKKVVIDACGEISASDPSFMDKD